MVVLKNKLAQETFYGARTRNPIRLALESPRMRKMIDEAKTASKKEFLSLSIGDPTLFGNFAPPAFFIDAVCEAVKDPRTHGYLPSSGKTEARAAVAEAYSYEGRQVSSEDVVLTCGCSGALEIIFKALLNPRGRGELRKILIPNPSFPLYAAQLNSYDLPFELYNLYEENNWECDLTELESKLQKDDTFVSILVNNPSNPMGTVYSKAYLEGLIRLAQKYKLVIVADEIYGDLTFGNHVFHPLAALSTSVPVIAVGGLAKEFIVPGFRLGWAILYSSDENDLLAVKSAAHKLSMLILGPCSIIQSALQSLLSHSNQQQVVAFKQGVINILSANADFLFRRLTDIRCSDGFPVFKVNRAQGSMYLFVKILIQGEDALAKSGKDRFQGDSVALMEQLIQKEQVFVLAGYFFGDVGKDMIRLTLTPPLKVLEEACDRIESYVKSYF